MRLFRRGERASTLALLVAGLGNPGREYANTRHNVGFMVVDELARRHGGTFRSKFSGELSELRIDGERVALLKPQTYMNESGRSVAAAATVLQGASRSHCSSSTTRSISSSAACRRASAAGSRATTGCARSRRDLGTPEFARLRIGVGRPERGDPRPVADWVLTAVRPRRWTSRRLVGTRSRRRRDAPRDGLDETQRQFNERP